MSVPALKSECRSRFELNNIGIAALEAPDVCTMRGPVMDDAYITMTHRQDLLAYKP